MGSEVVHTALLPFVDRVVVNSRKEVIPLTHSFTTLPQCPQFTDSLSLVTAGTPVMQHE